MYSKIPEKFKKLILEQEIKRFLCRGEFSLFAQFLENKLFSKNSISLFFFFFFFLQLICKFLIIHPQGE